MSGRVAEEELDHGMSPTTPMTVLALCRPSCLVSMPNAIRPTATLFGGVVLSAIGWAWAVPGRRLCHRWLLSRDYLRRPFHSLDSVNSPNPIRIMQFTGIGDTISVDYQACIKASSQARSWRSVMIICLYRWDTYSITAAFLSPATIAPDWSRARLEERNSFVI